MSSQKKFSSCFRSAALIHKRLFMCPTVESRTTKFYLLIDLWERKRKQSKNKDENIHKQQSLLQHYRQTYGKNIYRIDAHLLGKSAQKNWSDISIRGRENHVSPQTWLTDGQTDGHLLLQISFATKNMTRQPLSYSRPHHAAYFKTTAIVGKSNSKKCIRLSEEVLSLNSHQQPPMNKNFCCFLK